VRAQRKEYKDECYCFAQAGKFDQRSTGAERKQMLERIIRAEADEDDEDEVPDDESVNQMIARSNDEYEEFQVSLFSFRCSVQ
jgi:hypothetical protein